ncbi:MAG: ATP-binding protein [Candidatus Coatesbacteria bacterium]|nr:ATP-binding protein [Candidatus Coatesbacteria bacterium]
MEELSLHILDIAENSIKANASFVTIEIIEDIDTDKMEIEITDNGFGMSDKMIEKALSPFFSTRTTRKIGLGLPLFKDTVEACEGSIKLTSEINRGTKVYASLRHSHIDRPPLGEIADTILMLVISYPDRDFLYRHKKGNREFTFDTREIKEILGTEVSINHPEVRSWLLETLKSGEKELN